VVHAVDSTAAVATGFPDAWVINSRPTMSATCPFYARGTAGCARQVTAEYAIGEDAMRRREVVRRLRDKILDRSGARYILALASVTVLRIASASILCGVLLYTDAIACRGENFEETIFFEDVPAKSTEPIVAQVTILQVQEKGPYTADDPYALFYVGIARVDRLLRGTLSSDTIKILAPFNDCQRGFGVGASGIVLGTTRIGSDGVLELMAISEMQIERRERQRSGNKN
jgi:hypothetical protein